MNHRRKNGSPVLRDRINAELQDSVDEELEMELDDERLDQMLAELADRPEPTTLDRHLDFRELLDLQRELVNLQDWVQHHRQKVVVIFEGRDSAGKGGVIKRITQRLNPRVCRVAALPAPNGRERTQWYFQRCGREACRCLPRLARPPLSRSRSRPASRGTAGDSNDRDQLGLAGRR